VLDLIDVLRASTPIFAAVCAVLGLVVGSFLNVVIFRLPLMLKARWRTDCQLLDAPEGTEAPKAPRYDLAYPPSTCPGCGSRIRAIDNIPVLSYVWLRGRCRQCRSPISLRYPSVELLCGFACGVIGWQFGFGIEAMVGLILTWFLIALAGIDLDTQYLPDELTLPLLWCGLLLSVSSGQGVGAFPVSPTEAIIGAAAGYLSLWSVYHAFRLLTGREGFGYGDFKLLAAVGAFGGWTILLPVILLSAMAGAIVGITLIALGRHGRHQPMPYGPFLAIAGWLVLVFPHALVSPWWPFGH
jgi:leader peptidase (prepilin peptidase)/N-methyltransferase